MHYINVPIKICGQLQQNRPSKSVWIDGFQWLQPQLRTFRNDGNFSYVYSVAQITIDNLFHLKASFSGFFSNNIFFVIYFSDLGLKTSFTAIRYILIRFEHETYQFYNIKHTQIYYDSVSKNVWLSRAQTKGFLQMQHLGLNRDITETQKRFFDFSSTIFWDSAWIRNDEK